MNGLARPGQNSNVRLRAFCGGWKRLIFMAWGMTLALNAGTQELNNLFFLHHSTGNGLIVEGNMRGTVQAYNDAHGTSIEFWDHGYSSDGLRNPNGEETGVSYGSPTDNTNPDGLHYIFTSSESDATACRNLILANHQVIAFKSCFPASEIPDTDTLNQYQTYYLEMRTVFDQHPDKLFVVMSTPPLHRLATSAESAANARLFANWLKSSEYLNGHTNIVCFDLFNYLAGTDNFLKYEYEGSHSGNDSHPNTLANQTVGPIFAQFLISSAIAYSPSPSPTPPIPSRRVMNDFDCDGKTDRAVYLASTGEWLASLSYNGSNWSQTVGGAGYMPATGDYDGDGKTDPAVYEEASGSWSVLLSANGYASATADFGGAGLQAAEGDYDGDGKTDPATFQESTGNWAVMLSTFNYALAYGNLGGPGFVAIPGDYDGDGLTDPAVYNESTGAWSVMMSVFDYAVVSATFGGSGFQAIPGDYDGDGLTDPATYQESTGSWTVMLSALNYGIASANLAGTDYVPVPGDYDGDGKTDLAAYLETTGDWLMKLSASNYVQSSANLGGSGYKPVYSGHHR
ncbi:MAG: hypothetical protein KKG09_03535 [Verrucomicrobia bacterium]|nr:hypothetical protein [Verrucomicrobiota bacterium]MCG2678550.1 hypothetical protein [Kiritimatiellia bacterium]MBU4247465.1 hypothetical protein [Verrucomicrobiota bacterium]MBU4292296.1 hypothetical protein [Verrucomicrobiota bacterium]MBU4429843.1 hypothetical protein [Verrucomicrobiota bacterium]